MIALFFEVLPRPDHEGTYFEMAAKLKPALDASGGLQFLDRSRSTRRPGWFLSHQIWRDEAAMTRWRVNAAHHRTQACGRTDILADYRLRVGSIIAEVGPGNGLSDYSCDPLLAYNHPADQPERTLVSIITKAVPTTALPPAELYDSVYDRGLNVIVAPVRDRSEGMATLARLDSSLIEAHGSDFDAGGGTANTHHYMARLCLISRDYGMFDRREAPQYFEPVTLA